MRKLQRLPLIFLFLALVSPWNQAIAFEEINLGIFSDVALDGYDTVAYFKQSKPVKGKKSFSYQWKKATWLFSSEDNRQLFMKNPETYAPQYGGYCSNQMSLGNISEIDTDVWRIVDNKLYFFGHHSGKERWQQKTSDRIKDADGHWNSYLKQ